MKFEDIQLSGSLDISGSMVLPLHAEDSDISNPIIGDLYFNTVSQSVKVYNGTDGGWQVLADQTGGGDIAFADIEYLVVAGGGGGGGTIAGGGGAGGLLSSSLASVESGSSFTITVGAGGDGGYGWGTYTPATAGEDSSIAGTTITTITAVGGGKGGDHYGNSSANNLPGDGGSGGGGGRSTSYPQAGGSATTGQGNDGGSIANGTIAADYGSGGGGAGAAGTTAGADADGGIGKQSSITGTSTYYAGGGGGGVRSSAGSDVGEGGSGGGGAGGTAQSATAGTANTGGGGGGAGYTAASSNKTGGDGGSGVAIFAYPTASISATGGVRTFFNDRVAHTFNSSGTFAVGGIKTYTHNTLDVFGDGSCIAFYKFEGNANDESGNYNGTASNVTYAQSYINNGAVFNGSSSKIVLPNSSLGITDASNFSISCWFNTNSSTQDNQGIIWTNGSNAGARFGLGINSTSQGGDTSVYFGIGTSSFTYINSGTSAFTANTWVHVVCVKSSTTGMSLYVDNVLKATNTGATGAASTTATGDNRIGGYKTTAESSWFNGSIDQVRIFSKALSASEVTTLYTE